MAAKADSWHLAAEQRTRVTTFVCLSKSAIQRPVVTSNSRQIDGRRPVAAAAVAPGTIENMIM